MKIECEISEVEFLKTSCFSPGFETLFEKLFDALLTNANLYLYAKGKDAIPRAETRKIDCAIRAI